jgi:hypothetical protein
MQSTTTNGKSVGDVVMDCNKYRCKIKFRLNMDSRELIDLSLRRPISAVFAN